VRWHALTPYTQDVSTRKPKGKSSGNNGASDGTPDPAAAKGPPSLVRPTVRVALGEMLGQGRAVSTLHAAVRSGRIHHAWIFSGPDGVGKMTAALGFAAILLDHAVAPGAERSLEPDPDSHVQSLLAAGTHPDLHVVRKELAPFSREARIRTHKQTVIPVDVLREFLIEPAARSRVLPGVSLASKVLIVDEAHLLGVEGQNALLKTLEEPPSGTVLILVTSNEARLLPTVRSRAQRVAFVALDDHDMLLWAARSGLLERLGTDTIPPWLAAIARGSPGRTLAALDGGLERWHRELGDAIGELPQGRYPVELASKGPELVEQLVNHRLGANPNASKDAANKDAARQLLAYVGDRLAAGMRDEAARATSPCSADSQRVDAWINAIDAVHRAEGYLGSNVQLKFVLDSLAGQLVEGFAGRVTLRG